MLQQDNDTRVKTVIERKKRFFPPDRIGLVVPVKDALWETLDQLLWLRPCRCSSPCCFPPPWAARLPRPGRDKITFPVRSTITSYQLSPIQIRVWLVPESPKSLVTSSLRSSLSLDIVADDGEYLSAQRYPKNLSGDLIGGFTCWCWISLIWSSLFSCLSSFFHVLLFYFPPFSMPCDQKGFHENHQQSRFVN